MSSNGLTDRAEQAAHVSDHAEEPLLTRRQKIRLVVKVVEPRLRFIALMAATGLVFAYWDTLWNRYDKWMRPTAERHAAVSGIEYYCPMHQQVVQNEPGTCPICGMPLAKRKKGEKTTLPPGVTARVELIPFRVKQAGIQTSEVGYAPLAQTLTTVGYVAFDERRRRGCWISIRSGVSACLQEPYGSHPGTVAQSARTDRPGRLRKASGSRRGEDRGSRYDRKA